MAKLEAVLFDIDDTLCPTTEFARRARRNAVRAMIAAGLGETEERVMTELEEVIAEFSSNYEHHFDKLLLRLSPSALQHQNGALIVAAGVAAYHDTKFRELRPFDGVTTLLSDLRRAGLRLGIITHGWTLKQAEKLVRLGLVRHFDPDAIFISDQIGISKPNPKIYTTALRAMQLEPQQAMYVGDNPRNDIAPPVGIGMVTVWSRRASRQQESPVAPTHEIWNFDELREILRTTYGVEISGLDSPAAAT